jgi:hypothetical protein
MYVLWDEPLKKAHDLQILDKVAIEVDGLSIYGGDNAGHGEDRTYELW